jgi:hypothetical protein
VVREIEQRDFGVNADYKRHDIHATALHAPDGWKPHLFVGYIKGGRNIFKNFTIDQTFATQQEAEQTGLSLAQKWIEEPLDSVEPKSNSSLCITRAVLEGNCD